LIARSKVEVGEYYQSLKSQHQENERIHVIQGLKSIMQLMLNGGRTKKKKKYIQFVTIFGTT
jgi:hypothetical protein